MGFMKAVALLACLTLCSASYSARATDATRTLAQLQHTALRGEDGAPAGATAMAQTEDGWLWLSTPAGLYRYDGFSFEKVPLLPPMSNETNATWSLFAAPGGDLWVGLANGGVARLRHGAVTLYDQADGLPHGVVVLGMRSASDGAIWGVTEVGLFRFDGVRWKHVDASWGVPDRPKQLFDDGRGGLWIGAPAGFYRLAPHARHFERIELSPHGGGMLLRGPQGRIVVIDHGGGQVRLAEGDWGKPHAVDQERRANSDTVTFDRDGNLWTVACAADLCRGSWQDVQREGMHGFDASVPQTFGESAGLSSEATMTLMEDRDGDVWVSTKMGVDRFRDSWLARVRFPSTESYFALVEDGDGRVFTGTSARSVHMDRLWALTPDPVALSGFGGAVVSAFRDTDGTVWLGGTGQLWRMRDGRPVAVDLPRGAAARDAIVQAIARDGAGRLWISMRLMGVFALDDDGWVPAAQIAAFPELAPALIHVDRQGRPWFGYLDGSVALLDGTKLTRYGADQGLGLGPVTAIASVDGHLVVAAEHALTFLDGDRFVRVVPDRAGALDSATGIVESKDGGIWIYGTAGVTHFTRGEWRAVLAHPERPAHVDPLTMEDGLGGPAQLVRPLPTALAARDGRLWFAGAQGLAWLDPTRQPAPRPPPPTVIRRIVSGGKSFDPDAVVVMKRSRDLDVSYTAIAPGYPNGVTFRYRLDGEDAGWHDAGSRREASYGQLRPGRYTFIVEASYDRVRWNRAETVDIEVLPRFIESVWFKLLCVLVLGALIWSVHRWRVGALTSQLRLRLNERHNERERIARELHDTLLQGAQGLVLRFQALVDRLSDDDASRAALERAIDRAEHLLVEGRDRVQGLRSGRTSGGELADRLAMLARDMDETIVVHVSGKPRNVNGLVQDEIYSIVREALGNAIQHSHARIIAVSLQFSRRVLQVAVHDDGVGFLESVVVPHEDKRFGVIGMRERAAHIGARFTLRTAPLRGTEIRLAVPARFAYLHGTAGILPRWRSSWRARRARRHPDR
ncbi:triple tyrosine motif-containing protein [Dyella sp. 333MFSha]|uniref:sensor histidine kinase n=1 Tax=Dyella sp. 333MFSha TaxID=1798240 RepID=UPI00088B1C43|nr:triple tyrosine motif-containing protein [Dyella sp. 333MFSha]SDG30917.1 Histidine kinase [Dyella sp. 333MFSha]